MDADVRRRLRVVNYDERWPAVFAQLRHELWAAVGRHALTVEHVGSTAVEGMAAKPIIDVDVVVRALDALPLVGERLHAIGYVHRGNLGIDGREVFDEAPGVTSGRPRHHLYVCAQNGLALRNHLTLRHHLRAHRQDVERYSALKRRLAERFPYDMDRYVAGKTELIVSILAQYGFDADDLESIRRLNGSRPGMPLDS